MPQVLQMLRLPSAMGTRELPVLCFQAAREGPCVVVTANVHGDEATGVGIVHALKERLDGLLVRGQVHLYPSLNPDGLVQRTRAVPADGQDLNRVWPGDPRGRASERLANALWQDIRSRNPSLVVDLHADSPASIPYAIIDRVVRARARTKLQPRLEKLAEATGLTVLREYPKELYVKYALDRSLSGAVTNTLGVPAVTVEAGPRLFLEPDAVRIGTEAVLGVLTAAGLVNRPATPHATRLAGGPWRRQSGPRVSVAGIFHARRAPGESFEAGDVLAEVCALDGRVLERLNARTDGYVISLPERTWAVPGVSAGTYAVADG